jgi:Holliday junction resolvase RusA-like endonuclease
VKSIKLTLPYPPSELLPNKKSNRWQKAEVTKQCRSDGFNLLYNEWKTNHPLLRSVNMVITFVPPNYRYADWDSLFRAFKPYLDSIVDIGILYDDSPKVIKQVTLKMGKPDKENPRTEVDISEVLS